MITPPRPEFSETDRRLIAFLACVLTGEAGGNVGEDLPALTHTEAEYLVTLLEKLVGDSRFQAASLIDSAAIFTTRDWSAIGALSAAAAVVGLDMQAERDR